MLKQLKFSVVLLVLVKYLVPVNLHAVTLIDFNIVNDCDKSLVILDFQGVPMYNFHFLHRPERLVLDVSYTFSPLCFKKYPINFFTGQLVHRIRIDKLIHGGGIRFIFDLISLSYVDDVCLEKNRGVNTVLLVITPKQQLSVSLMNAISEKKEKGYTLSSYVNLPVSKKNRYPFISYIEKKLSNNIIGVTPYSQKMFSPITVAIDAGHGGHDPGAKGYSGLYEKNITMAIAKKFKKILDQDPIFSPIMIRDGDYFISVLDRSELARNKGAKILLSIHADAISQNSKKNVRGSSVWVLSDRGAKIEISNVLENNVKWSQLFEGTNDIFIGAHNNSDQYFHRALLDLQFCHSQRVGYEIALHILRELKNVGVLHKYIPEYSNFAVLRSLGIPSVLVETGFITNVDDEKLLANDYHQEKIACALYKGLRSYFLGHISCFENPKDDKLCSHSKSDNKYLYKNHKYKCT